MSNEKSLRSQVIRLAHEHPEFRKDLLPLVAKKAGKVARGGLTVGELIRKLGQLDDNLDVYVGSEEVVDVDGEFERDPYDQDGDYLVARIKLGR